MITPGDSKKLMRKELTNSAVPPRVVDLLLGGNLNVPAGGWLELLGDALGRKPMAVLAGPVGGGKTVAAAHAMAVNLPWHHDERRPLKALFVPAYELMQISPYGSDLERLSQPDVLVLDDLGREYLDEKGFLLALIDALLNHRYDRGLITVMTTNLNAVSFSKRYGERIVDRLREVGTFIEANIASQRGGNRE